MDGSTIVIVMFMTVALLALARFAVISSFYSRRLSDLFKMDTDKYEKLNGLEEEVKTSPYFNEVQRKEYLKQALHEYEEDFTKIYKEISRIIENHSMFEEFFDFKKWEFRDFFPKLDFEK